MISNRKPRRTAENFINLWKAQNMWKTARLGILLSGLFFLYEIPFTYKQTGGSTYWWIIKKIIAALNVLSCARAYPN